MNEQTAAEAADPHTAAQRLADIAQHHPELWPVIEANPAAYAGLIDWIAEQRAASIAAATAVPIAPVTPFATPAPRGPSWFSRQWSTHRVRTVVALGAAAAVLVAGSGVAVAMSITRSAPPQDSVTADEQEATASAKPTPAPTATATPVKPTAVLAFDIDENGGLINEWNSIAIGPKSFLIADGDGEQELSHSRSFDTVSISDTEPLGTTRALYQLPNANYSIRNTIYGAQGDADAASSFAIAMVVEQPASGVSPAVEKVDVAVFPAFASTASTTTSLDICAEDGCSLTSPLIVDDVAILALQDGRVYGLDTGSGTVLWTNDGFEPYATSGGLVIGASGTGFDAVFGSEDSVLVALDAQTGAQAWTFAPPEGQDFFRFEETLSLDYALVSSGSSTRGTSNIIDMATGATLVSRLVGNGENTADYDPSTDSFVLVSRPDVNSSGQFEVISAATGEVTLSVLSDQFAALGGIALLGATDSLAWNGSLGAPDIFSTVTGEQDPRSPALVENDDDLPDYHPVVSIGDVSIVERDYGARRVIIHQNQLLTFELLDTQPAP